MSDTIATYTFLPWLRQGIANKITSGDMDPAVKVRASINVALTINGDGIDGSTVTKPVSKDVQLYGPADIIGVDPRAIVKNEPHNWITNFEPNYLPYIEFYDEDFPWRYTPAAPDTARDRLRPWLALVILKEGDFEEGKNIQDKPLSFITVDNAATKFPPAEQSWAWAHVHVSDSLMNKIAATPADKDAVISAFTQKVGSNPDIASSRLLCPMKLEENTAYHAFLVPAFETGRLAGLGRSMKPEDLPAAIHATLSAWADYSGREDTASFPYYHRWYFRTGTVGDFEYLVRLLQPRPVDKKVGRKDMDVQYPGSNLHGIDLPELGGILKLGGALQVPFDTMTQPDKDEVTKYEEWDQHPYPAQFQKDLAAFINLADDYGEKTAPDANNATSLDPDIKSDCDPLITAPLYGRWHALVSRLLKNRDGTDITPNANWVHELNLDPRFRVAAGFGTRVIQDNQEDYMSAAWKQIGDVLEANRKMRLAQLAKAASWSWYKNQIDPLVKTSSDKALQLLAPMQKRVLSSNMTVYYQVSKSRITTSVTSSPMRKIMRPGGRVMKTLTFTSDIKATNLLARINDAQVLIAPPKVIPATLPTMEQLGQSLLPKNVPPFLLDLLKKSPWIKLGALLLALLLVLLIFLLPSLLSGFLGLIAALLIAFYVMATKWEKQLKAADALTEENQTPASVDALPTSPDFVLSNPGDNFTPGKGSTDSKEGIQYKAALKDSLNMLAVTRNSGKVVERTRLDLPAIVDVTFTAIDPVLTIPRLIYSSLLIPERIRIKLAEEFTEVWAYPELDIPMYKPLVKISSEMFLPNINFISENTISLLETNQKFIESYMVGLNHEFARELFWREYLTDQRGSYFRQFWDVSSFFDGTVTDEAALKERLRDIPPLHKWSKFSELGDHDNREAYGDKEEELVLVIRGELLKKYPNAVIYAHQAQWQLKEDGTINNQVERELVTLTAAEEDKPPRTKIKTPLYEAKVDPDIYFFGFDLTALKAKGGTGETQADLNNAGWFFCIKERPGEPRFGLDIDKDTTPNVWNDLSWQDILPGAPAGAFMQITDATPTITLSPLDVSDNEKTEQRADDNFVSWNKDMNAAEVAYILYQAPVLVAVHASEMLPKP
ncbi:hypothetical protein [Chitinophaga sp. MM2321]|uniref:hypothetical protein n=1 Tax=Chitinophaga sp. MM2321 TaxID=3137178 RepID=UPI0032D59260